ncbi:MAG: AsmA family protein, partial [Alphaproteobacteria bacterium]|nr:AsmA family protein [Alphaproteobacteria bacterium]
MKKLLIGVLVLVVVVIAAAFIVPFFIPLDTIKEQITTRAEDATGRKLTIAGDFELSILPRVKIKASDVTFANAPGAKQANMLELAELEVGLSLFPLISGNVELTSFVLVDPVINLEIDAKGRPNWQFEEKEASDDADDKGEKSGDGGGGSKGLREISLGDVRLVNGTVRFSDAQAGTSQEIQSINAEINLPSLDQTLTVKGSLVWNGETIDLTAQVDEPRALMEGASTGVQAAIKAAPVSFDYKGTVTNAKPVAVSGDISLNVPSIRGLAAWAGKPIEAAGGGLGPLSIKGKLDMAGKSIAFKDAEISIDNMNAKGDFEVDISGRVPSIVASLEVDKLDLNTYLPPESDKPAAAPSGGGAPAAGSASGGKSDWSDDPIDFSALNLVNADLSFVTGGITVQKIKVGRTALKMLLKGGKLSLDLSEMALYGGQGTGRITVDAGRNAITQKLDLKGVQAAPLLTDAAGFDRVEGTANIVVDVKTRGASQRQLISALNGNGSIQFLDGAVRGINIGAMVRNISSAFLDASARETQKTDFAELAGTYTITNGIVKNDDLFLKSPLLRVDGKGTSDLPKRTVDYRVTPKVVASTKGQGGESQLGGLSVPVQITGPWDNLAFAPDLSGAIDEL